MAEKCPMCGKHDIIRKIAQTHTEINGKPICYEEEYCYCSTLGENDPDCYFIPPEMMNSNLQKARRAYEMMYGISQSTLYYIASCCCYSDSVSISMGNNDIEIQMRFNFDNELDASIFYRELRKMTNSFNCQARITVEEIMELYEKVKKR
jgi:hypothetical protein